MFATGLLAILDGAKIRKTRASKSPQLDPLAPEGSGTQTFDSNGDVPTELSEQEAPWIPAVSSEKARARIMSKGWLRRMSLRPDVAKDFQERMDKRSAEVVRFGRNWLGEDVDYFRAKAIDRLITAVEDILTPKEVEGFRYELSLEELNPVINGIGSELFARGQPLTSAQQQALISTIVSSRSEEQLSKAVLRLHDTMWEKVVDQSKSFLTAGQLSAVKEVATRQHFNKDLYLLTGSYLKWSVPRMGL